LRPVERLDLAFLIDRKDNGMGRRRDIAPDDVMQFLRKSLVIRQFEEASAARRKAVHVQIVTTEDAAIQRPLPSHERSSAWR
jgi:hypothetical protein